MPAATAPGRTAVHRRAVLVIRETGASVTSVFKNRNLRLIQVALLTSLVGDLAYTTAVTVWAYGVGGTTVVAVLTAVRLAAAAVTAPLAAVVADRVGRRTTLLVTDAARAVLVAAAAGCLVVDPGSPWPVYVLATLAGVLAAPFRTAQRAWMPALARHPRELTASNATSGTLESLAVFVGPALGGLLVLATSVPTVFILNVATFVVSMLLVAGVRPARQATTREPVTDHGGAPGPVSWAHELSAGFATLLRDPDLRSVTGQVCAQTFVGGAAKVFLVVVAVQILGTGAAGVGLLEAVLGIGAIVGGIVAIARAERQRLGRDMATGVLLWSTPLLVIVVWPSTTAVVISLLLVGAANPLVDVNLDTIVQRMAPDATLARVFGALDTCYIATSALGSLAMVPLLDLVDLRWSLVVLAVPTALVALLSLPRMRRLDGRLTMPAGLPLLQRVPWLAPLAPAVQESMARSLEQVRVPTGSRVVTQGEPADRFYMIESGAVEVTQDGRVLRRQGVGEFFGEIGLLHDIPRTATVTATEETVLQALGRDRFLAGVVGQHRSLADEIAAARMVFRG